MQDSYNFKIINCYAYLILLDQISSLNPGCLLIEYYDQTQPYVHYSQAEGKYIEAREDKVEYRLYYNSFDVAGMGIDDFYVNKRNGYIYQVTGEKDNSWVLTYQGCFKWIPDVVANDKQARYNEKGELTELP